MAVSKNQHKINPMYDYFHITKVHSKGRGVFQWRKPEYELMNLVLSYSSKPFQQYTTKNIFRAFHCSQISAGDHMQIIGDPIGAVEVKVLTSQTHTYKLGRV